MLGHHGVLDAPLAKLFSDAASPLPTHRLIKSLPVAIRETQTHVDMAESVTAVTPNAAPVLDS